jgi:glycosyltransferase involved in cell wall biosynthesis
MSLAEQITGMILTYNEEDNLGRTLASLAWLPRILVVDSGSSDGTLAIIERFPQAEVITRSFDTFATQCNFGLSLIASPWVLSLDADYVVSESLAREIRSLAPAEKVSGFRASFIHRIYGRDLRSTIYPPRTVLYRRNRARYCDVGHAHRVQISGPVIALKAHIYHDDRKPLSRWLTAQQKYAKREADYLLETPKSHLRRVDRIRLMGWPAPLLVFLYTLIVKRCILEGWAGWLYVLQRTVAEAMVALELADRRARKALGGGNSVPRWPRH